MRFRTRLILTFSIIVITLIFGIMLLFGQYYIQEIKETSMRDLEMLSQAVSYQLEDLVSPMVFIGDFLLSDMNTLSAINTLTEAERFGTAQQYIMRAKHNIQLSLSTYCIDKNFYKVNVFSVYGDLVSSGSISGIENPSALLEQFPDLDKIDAAMGKSILLPPHPDTWNLEAPKTVFSLVRTVRGGTYPCYIEVQKEYSSLEAFFSLYAAGENRIAIVSKDGEVFFSQLTDQQNAYLIDTISLERNKTIDPCIIAQNFFQFDDSLISVRFSSYTNMYIVAALSKDVLANAVSNRIMFTVSVFALICVISIVFIYLASTKLAAPIRKLTLQMEKTTLENMEDEITVEHTSNEIKMLSTEYKKLMQRLSLAASREKQLGMLQQKTQFDALQAQVNPHFIYNVLNMISHYGLSDGNETVCNICDKLAGMLRYSTGTMQRVVTIATEIAYIKQYLYLLKIRYESKLNCEIDINPSIQQQLIPKIVLQQIVENAINHGFKSHSGAMFIALEGWEERGYWFIRINDNGSGFSIESMQTLQKKISEVTEKIMTNDWNMEIDIGGMGLVNAFARMRLLMGEDIVFRYYNKNENAGGAIVEIGAKLNKEVGIE
ncbi:MAG: histidine kinase [Synergistaceae bacterium]|nr:histidine kinase [Synergistaceae bacterium]